MKLHAVCENNRILTHYYFSYIIACMYLEILSCTYDEIGQCNFIDKSDIYNRFDIYSRFDIYNRFDILSESKIELCRQSAIFNV